MALITRDNAAALIPEDAAREIIKTVPEMSAVMQLARRLPNMSRNQRRMPVMSALATAAFVSGDTGQKTTSNVEWTNKYLNAEELAVIVPIPEAVLDDVDYDIWGEVQPSIAEAIGQAFDAAVLLGTNAPTSWPDDIVTAATAAGNTVTLGAAGGDLYDDIMGENGTIAQVEADGFMVNGHLGDLTMRAKLRGLRGDDGHPIFVRTMQGMTAYELDGNPTAFPKNGGTNPATALMFSGDWSQLVYSIRQDLTYKIFDTGVIQDTDDSILYNLLQDDMVALRAVIRLAWQLPNPINRVQAVEESRYPFSVLLPAGA